MISAWFFLAPIIIGVVCYIRSWGERVLTGPLEDIDTWGVSELMFAALVFGIYASMLEGTKDRNNG